jgi:Tol biopolymer transport system component
LPLDPAVSPAGEKIAFVSARDGNEGEIYAINSLNGSRQRRFTPDAGGPIARTTGPSFSVVA